MSSNERSAGFTLPSPHAFSGCPGWHLSKWRAVTVLWSISAILEVTVVVIVKVVAPTTRMEWQICVQADHENNMLSSLHNQM